jgi:hypothetical protein
VGDAAKDAGGGEGEKRGAANTQRVGGLHKALAGSSDLEPNPRVLIDPDTTRGVGWLHVLALATALCTGSAYRYPAHPMIETLCGPLVGLGGCCDIVVCWARDSVQRNRFGKGLARVLGWDLTFSSGYSALPRRAWSASRV